jgi:hypothetical protein
MSATDWLKLLMSAYPEDELKYFYHFYLGELLLSSSSAPASDDDEKKEEKENIILASAADKFLLSTFRLEDAVKIADSVEKETWVSAIPVPTNKHFPYQTYAFFGFSDNSYFGSSFDFTKLVTFDELAHHLANTTHVCTGRSWMEKSTSGTKLSTKSSTSDSKIIELFLQ